MVARPTKDLTSFEGRKWLQQISFASSGLESDPHYSGSPASTITNSQIAHWNEAYTWGDHNLEGYEKTDTITEVPVGAINGVNATFFLTATPVANSLSLYINGVFAIEGGDYTLSGTIITILTSPLIVGDTLLAQYLEA